MTDNTQIPVEMYNMIKQFNKQREEGLICDAKCQNSNRVRKLQYKVAQNEKTLSDAAGTLLNSQRTLSQFDPKGYGPIFTKNINTMANNQIEKLSREFNRSKSNIMQNLDFYDTQFKFKQSMINVENNELEKLNKLNEQNKRNIGDVRVNQRMSRFYKTKTDYLESWVKKLKYMFWTTICILLVIFFYYRNNDKITNKKMSLGIVFLFITIGLIHFLMPVFKFIWKLLSFFPKP